MGTAVATYEPVQRPGLLEISSILLLCAALVLGLAHLDRQGRERMTKRSEQVARTPAASPPRAPAPAAPKAPAAGSATTGPVAAAGRSGDLSVGPVPLLLMGGAGLSMAGVGLRLLSRRSV